jgi:hypothetical protein
VLKLLYAFADPHFHPQNYGGIRKNVDVASTETTVLYPPLHHFDTASAEIIVTASKGENTAALTPSEIIVSARDGTAARLDFDADTLERRRAAADPKQALTEADAILGRLLAGEDKPSTDAVLARIGREEASKPIHYRDVTERLHSLIPQLCCAGQSHYSDTAVGPLVMINMGPRTRHELDRWKRLFVQNPELAAHARIGITTIDFSDSAKQSPAAFLRQLMKEYPGMITAIGEITIEKEMVAVMLGKEKLTFESRALDELLRFAEETGLSVLLHSDLGTAEVTNAGHPTATVSGYQYQEPFANLLARYPKLRVVHAHTGIGRFVRPDERPSQTAAAAGSTPQHFTVLEELLTAVPNMKFDGSWQDVVQAFAESRNLRQGFANFVLNRSDILLLGTDSVKPVDPNHYRQAITSALPLIATVARRARSEEEAVKVVWNLLRGNFEQQRDSVQADVVAWTGRELASDRRAGRISEAQYVERTAFMNGMVTDIAGRRSKMSKEAYAIVKEAVSELRAMPEAPTNNPGVFPALAASIYERGGHAWTPEGPTGPGTPGGFKDGTGSPQQVLAAGLAGVTTTGALIASALAGDPSAAANSGAFGLRAALGWGRAVVGEALRLKWEKIFEERSVTAADLDQFFARIVAAKGALDLSDEQVAQIGAAIMQFWANYRYLRDDARVEPKLFRDAKIAAEVGRMQITVDRLLGSQQSSYGPLGPRRWPGRLLRFAILGTYVVNNAATAAYLRKNGLDHSTVEALAQTAYVLAFGAGNTVLGAHSGISLSAGMAGVNWDGRRWMQQLNLLGSSLLIPGGAAWTGADIMKFMHDFADGRVTDATLSALAAGGDMGFTVSLAGIVYAESRKLGGQGVFPPGEAADLQRAFNAILAARMVIEGFRLAMGERKDEQRKDQKRKDQQPTPAR